MSVGSGPDDPAGAVAGRRAAGRCLSGVWAHDAAASHGYDAGQFDATAQELIRSVSSNAEIHTHGTPDDRFTALDRGLGTGRPSSCRLDGLR